MMKMVIFSVETYPAFSDGRAFELAPTSGLSGSLGVFFSPFKFEHLLRPQLKGHLQSRAATAKPSMGPKWGGN
jgi:hypothetical protein